MSLSPTCVRIERIFVKVSFEAVFRAGSYSYQLTAGGKNSLLGRRRRRKGDDKIEFLEKRWRSTSWPSTSCWWSGWEEHCWRNAMMTTMFVRSIGWHCPPLQKWPWMELNSATRSWWWFYVWGLCQSNILSGYKSSSNVFPIFLWRSNKTPHISAEIKQYSSYICEGQIYFCEGLVAALELDLPLKVGNWSEGQFLPILNFPPFCSRSKEREIRFWVLVN